MKVAHRHQTLDKNDLDERQRTQTSPVNFSEISLTFTLAPPWQGQRQNGDNEGNGVICGNFSKLSHHAQCSHHQPLNHTRCIYCYENTFTCVFLSLKVFFLDYFIVFFALCNYSIISHFYLSYYICVSSTLPPVEELTKCTQKFYLRKFIRKNISMKNSSQIVIFRNIVFYIYNLKMGSV